jgi:hypothetical protein
MAARPTYRYKRIKARRKQESEEYRKLVITLGVLVLSAVLVFFIGVPFLAKMGGFLSKLFQGDASIPIGKQDTIAPRPPYIDNLPNGVKDKVIEVSGLTEPGSTVALILNDERSKEILADGEGGFTFEYVPLKAGENTITVTAKDDAGNESDPAQEIKIIYKSSAPKLDVQTPTENQIFKETDNPIRVAGQTDPQTKVYVDETLAIVDTEGNFEKYLVLRDEGSVTIKFKAIDIAGNISEEEVKVLFQKR